TALRSITYRNTNDSNPSVANRTVTFSVTDGNSNGEGTGSLTTRASRDIIIANKTQLNPDSIAPEPILSDALPNDIQQDPTTDSGIPNLTSDIVTPEPIINREVTDQLPRDIQTDQTTGTFPLTSTIDTVKESQPEAAPVVPEPIQTATLEPSSSGREVEQIPSELPAGTTTTGPTPSDQTSTLDTVKESQPEAAPVVPEPIQTATLEPSSSGREVEQISSELPAGTTPTGPTPSDQTSTLDTVKESQPEADPVVPEPIQTATLEPSSSDREVEQIPSEIPPGTTPTGITPSDQTSTLDTLKESQPELDPVAPEPNQNVTLEPSSSDREVEQIPSEIPPGSTPSGPMLPDQTSSETDKESPPEPDPVAPEPIQISIVPLSPAEMGIDEVPGDIQPTSTITAAPDQVPAPIEPAQEIQAESNVQPDGPEPIPASVLQPSPTVVVPESIRIPGHDLDAATQFAFSQVKDYDHALDNPYFIPDASADGQYKIDGDATDPLLRLHGVSGTDGDDAEFLSNILVKRSELDTGGSRTLTTDDSHESQSGPKRSELKIGTTLRNHDAHVYMPSLADDEQKSQRGIAGYGLIEAKGEERGMPGLTSQLNSYGPKAFQAELQDLMQTIKDAVN
ncbi:MAG: hypothetical protein H7839_20340, partial [Magnetococcus sp. YQC-5]